MTEAEKMLAGLPYDIMAPELKALRRKAHEAVYAYNLSDPQQYDPPSAILQDLLGSLARAVFVETPFRCAYGEIGRAHVRTPVTNAHLVGHLLLVQNRQTVT